MSKQRKQHYHRIEWPIVFLVPIAFFLTILGSEIGWFQNHSRDAKFRVSTGKAIAQTTEPVTREVLAKGKPEGEPCRVLELVRYTIHPGANLPPHTHPGMQISQIVSGEITYLVVQGETEITQADGSVTILKSGDNIKLYPKDSIVEPGGVIHFGQNQGSQPVVLLSSSLLLCDAPLSEVVK